jgi:hypothetical protein
MKLGALDARRFRAVGSFGLIEVTFHVEGGRVLGLTLRQDGTERRLVRVDGVSP